MLSNTQRAEKGTACHSCRKMKLRCNAASQFPAPCTRCANARRACSLGTTTQARDSGDLEDPSTRIAQLEEDVRELRRTLHTSSEASAAPGSTSTQDELEPVPSAAQLAADLGLAMPTRNLGGIEISPDDHFDLIDSFFTQFHTQLPFIPSKRALVRDCVACPLLYWAVVAVASRTSPTFQTVLPRLVWPVRRLAAESALQPRSLAVIQALLLLCLWPMPFAALIDDPSWSFSGIASHKALLLGLHRPFDALVRSAKGDKELAQAMLFTWTACCIVAQMLSDRFGVPNQLSMDWHITKLPAPPVLAAVAEAVQKDCVMSSLLAHQKPGTDKGPSSMPVLKACEAWLEDLEARLPRHQSPLLDRLLCSLKLRLYSCWLGANMHAGNSSHENSLHMASYVSKAHKVALHVLDTSLEDQSAAHAPQGQEASAPCALWTFIDLQSVLMATFTLLHLTRRQRSLSGASTASVAIQRAHATLQACSVVEGDHFYRVCDVISYHLAAQAPMAAGRASEEPTGAEDVAPTIGPGMGVGVAHDMLKEAKRRYRRGKRFPEQFPDVDAGAGEAEAESSSVTGSTEEWPEFPLSQFLAVDFDLASWPQWDGGGVGLEMVDPMSQFSG